MELWQALILGLIEGLTEYLPVSSTGHLLIAQRWLGIEASAASNAYAIVIQAGAIVAVLGLYRQRVGQLVLGALGRDEAGRRLLFGLVVAFVPAAAIGFLFDDPIERVLFGPWPVVAAWAAGGLLLLALAPRLRGRPGSALELLRPSAAFWIGLAQCAALWPGVSRSMATILGGVAVGLSIGSAVEFSFLLGLLTLGAATAYKALSSGALLLHTYGPLPLLVGFASAWLSAVLAVRWMVQWLSQRGLGLFGWWRLIAAALVAAWLLRSPAPASGAAAPAHSWRSASIGFKLAALRAGRKPNSTPTMAENPNASAKIGG
jgi:undecaprenyl-diphosphatase